MPQVPLHVRIDVQGSHWSIALDGLQVHDNPSFPYSVNPTSIVFVAWTDVRIAEDNIVVIGAQGPVSVDSDSWGEIKGRYR